MLELAIVLILLCLLAPLLWLWFRVMLSVVVMMALAVPGILIWSLLSMYAADAANLAFQAAGRLAGLPVSPTARLAVWICTLWGLGLGGPVLAGRAIWRRHTSHALRA